MLELVFGMNILWSVNTLYICNTIGIRPFASSTFMTHITFVKTGTFIMLMAMKSKKDENIVDRRQALLPEIPVHDTIWFIIKTMAIMEWIHLSRNLIIFGNLNKPPPWTYILMLETHRLELLWIWVVLPQSVFIVLHGIMSVPPDSARCTGAE